MSFNRMYWVFFNYWFCAIFIFKPFACMARVAADILCLMQMSTGLNDENILSLCEFQCLKSFLFLKKTYVWANSRWGKTVCKWRRANITRCKNNTVYSIVLKFRPLLPSHVAISVADVNTYQNIYRNNSLLLFKTAHFRAFPRDRSRKYYFANLLAPLMYCLNGFGCKFSLIHACNELRFWRS